MRVWPCVGVRFLDNTVPCIAPGFLDSGLTVFASTLPRPARRGRVEPELTAKVARLNDIRLFEVGISYMGRTYTQGKKIGWRDGREAAWCILKYSRRSRGGGAW